MLASSSLLRGSPVPFRANARGTLRKAGPLPVRAGLNDALALGAASGLSAFSDAPPEALLALGGAALLAAVGIGAAALQQTRGEGSAAAASPPPLPREDAVLVFGATGRMGRVLVDAVRQHDLAHVLVWCTWCSQLLQEGRLLCRCCNQR